MPWASRSSTSSRMASAIWKAILSADILPRKRPVQNRHGAGQHPLDGFVRQAVGIDGIFDGNRLGAADISPNDRRLDAPGSVGLHPTVFGKNKAVQTFAKIFDHIVPFKLAMHKHVKADFLLAPDAFCDLIENKLLVLRLRQWLSSCRPPESPAHPAFAGKIRSWWSAASGKLNLRF